MNISIQNITNNNEFNQDLHFNLIHGDCIDILKKINNQSVHLVFTDPPYNLGHFMHNRKTNLKKMRENQFAYAGWDNVPYDEWLKDMDIFLRESSRILVKGGSLLVFMAIIKVESIIELAEKNGFYYKTTGIWHKTNPMPRNMNLHFINSTEAWIYFTYGSKTGTFNNKGKLVHDFFETSLTTQSEKRFGKHPTQKPIRLIDELVSLLSNEGDTVVDPFMGSGTTAVSCKKLNRSFIGIEQNIEYIEIARRRVKELTK